MSNKPHWRPSRKLVLTVLAIGVLIIIALLLNQSDMRFYLRNMWIDVSASGNLPIILSTITIFLGMIIFLIGGYRYKWSWTGFSNYAHPKNEKESFQRGKTLWDWMQLLIIPVVLAGIALWFNQQSALTEHKIAQDNQREALLQEYIDKISDLLLNYDLRTSQSNAEIRNIARTRTLSVLRRLDGERKSIVLQFLYDSQLISTSDPIISLDGADLSGIHLIKVNLSGANLSGVNLQNAYIGWSNLEGISLYRADLDYASLHGSLLQEADLRQAQMTQVDLGRTVLQGAFVDDYIRDADLTDTDLNDVIWSH